MKTSLHKQLQSAFNSFYQSVYIKDRKNEKEALYHARQIFKHIFINDYIISLELVKTGEDKGLTRRIEVLDKNNTLLTDVNISYRKLDVNFLTEMNVSFSQEEKVSLEDLLEIRGHGFNRGKRVWHNHQDRLKGEGAGVITSYALSNDKKHLRYNIKFDNGGTTAWNEINCSFFKE